MGLLCCCCGQKKDQSEQTNKQSQQQDNSQQEIEPKKSRLDKQRTRIQSEDKTKTDSGKEVTSASDKSEKSGLSKRASIFKYNEIDEEPGEEKKLIEDEKLKEELKHAIKGGETAYEIVYRKNPNLRKKSLSASQYNKSGLVDKQSKEFTLVQEFMAKRGYQVLDSIGSGNYAEVYKAINLKKNKNVAVKVIDLKKANQNYRVNFLPREIVVLRQLKHPAIIKIYEIAQTANKIFMVMEWAANGTIADWLRDKGAFTETTAWIMFREVLEALHYMHTMRIAHRDLKLENILVTAKLNPKLSDFSYAIVVDSKNPKSDTFCGSLPYFSPEILQRIPYNPFISDVWSLGVCLFIMLNDGLPFKIGDDRLMLEKQLTKDWRFRNKVDSKLSPELKLFIKKMLEPDVNKRATTNILINDQWIRTKRTD